MELTKNCRGCKCATCRWQGTDNCLHDYECWCDVCQGRPVERADRYIAKSWVCRVYESRQTCGKH